MDLEYKDFLMEKVREHDLFINCTKSKNLVPKMEKAYYDFIDERNREEQRTPPPPITPPDSMCGTPPVDTGKYLTKEEDVPPKEEEEVEPIEEEEVPFCLTPEHSKIKKGTILTRSWADMAEEDDDDIAPLMMFGALLTQSDSGIVV
jgi:hypothetical protein